MEVRQRSLWLALLLLSPGLAVALPDAGEAGVPWALWRAALPAEPLGIAPAIAGGAFVAGSGPDGAWLAQLAPDGAAGWSTADPASAWLGVAALPDGAAVVAGADVAGAQAVPAVAMYDHDGAQPWRSTLRLHGTLRSVAAGPRSIVAAGDSGLDVLAARWGTDGRAQWQRTLGSALEDHGAAVALASDDTSFVVGWSYDGLRNRMLAWHLDAQGKVLWQRTLVWPGGSIRAYAAGADAEGRLLVAGAVAGGALSMPFLARFDAGGATGLFRAYPELAGPGAAALAADATGGAVLAGATQDGHGFVLRVTASGDPAWAADLGSGSAANALALDALGVLAAGTVQGQGMAQRFLDTMVRPA